MKVVGLLLALIIPSLAAAQSVAFVDDEGGVVPRYKTIVVVGNDGSRVTARLADTTRTSLVVMARALDGEFSDRREIPVSSIRYVERPDPLWNGALIGFLLTAVPALADNNAKGAFIGGGVTAAFGMAVDAFIPSHKYFTTPFSQRKLLVAPVLRPGQRGAFLTVKF